MPSNSPNFLKLSPKKAFAAIFLLLILVALAVFFWPFVRLGKEFLFGPVLKRDNGRTNILLLGTGDQDHDGLNLTDAMIVLSLKDKSALLLSVPRDIYLDSLNDKINSAYAQGMEKSPPTGLIMAQEAVGQVTGLPIHYALKIDFSAFNNIIDTLGGIDINVERTFDDYEYPLSGKENDLCGLPPETETFPCRFEHIHFDAGLTHMDGKTALKFVRSRHAQGEEGTDFARSRRQQLVLQAVKAKIIPTQIFLNPKRIWDLYNELKAHIDTNLGPGEINQLLNITLKYRDLPVKSFSIDENFLDNPPEDARGWILLPRGGNWDQVHKFIKDQLQFP